MSKSNFQTKLMAELVSGELPFELVRRPMYDLLIIQSGFQMACSGFFRDNVESLLKPKPKHLIVQVRRAEEIDTCGEVLLAGLREVIEASGSGFRVYPLLGRTSRLFEERSCQSLKEALEQLGIVAHGGRNQEIVDIICKAAHYTLAVQARTTPSDMEEGPVSAEVRSSFYSGVIEFGGGDIDGSIVVSAQKQVLDRLTLRMVGSQNELSDEVVSNTVCEMVNIVSGVAKSKMNSVGYEIKISDLPSLITPDFQGMMSGYNSGACYQIHTDLGGVFLEVRFMNVNG